MREIPAWQPWMETATAEANSLLLFKDVIVKDVYHATPRDSRRWERIDNGRGRASDRFGANRVFKARKGQALSPTFFVSKRYLRPFSPRGSV